VLFFLLSEIPPSAIDVLATTAGMPHFKSEDARGRGNSKLNVLMIETLPFFSLVILVKGYQNTVLVIRNCVLFVLLDMMNNASDSLCISFSFIVREQHVCT
jgi:hypothetical protein